MNFNTRDKEGLVDTLYEAQEHLNEAISLLETYVRRTGDRNAEAYILDHLRIFAGRNHSFLSHDLNLDDLIERLNENEDEEEESAADEAPLAHIRTATGIDLYWCNSAGRYVTIPMDDED
jgi:hypothetical protein